jgi:hypothetical protein
LAELAGVAYEHARSISGLAYRLNEDDTWLPYMLSPNQPQYPQFKLLQLKSMGADYADQTSALNALHEKTGKDIFVAKFAVVQKRGTDEVRSYCVWSDWVTSFLPRTDDIYFFRPKAESEGDVLGSAAWEQAEAILGDLLKPVGIYPERYLVEAFPTAEQFAALGLK